MERNEQVTESRAATPLRMSYTLDEFAAVTGFNRSQLYRFIADGKLRTFKAGRRRMVSATAGRELIANLEREAA
jgi:excisionase family DNA binding protein